MSKQIYAGLEIADHEIRLIVGEFLNTRLNILRVERVDCDGLSAKGIKDKDALIDAIKKALENVKNNLGLPVTKVILSVPSVNVSKTSVKENVPLNSVNKMATYKDIRRGISNGMRHVTVPDGSAIVQVNCVKYYCNGISSRRAPIDESLDDLSILMDVYFADKKFLYDLALVVEQCGLTIMQLFLDGFAIGKEASLFVQSMDKYVILLDGQYYNTKLSLFSDGRLQNFISLPIGMQSFVEALQEKYRIDFKYASRLIKYNVRLNADVLSSQTAYVWSEDDKTLTINEQQIYDAIKPKVDAWVDMVKETIDPILQAGKASVVISDDIGEMQGVVDLLNNKLDCEVKVYAPETLGVRNSCLTSCVGLFYAYKDLLDINGRADASVDIATFNKLMDIKTVEAKEQTITGKLKSVLLKEKK